MDVNGVGFLTAILVGGVAGWIAERVMRSDMGLMMNIILGIAGAVVLNAILALLDTGFGEGVVAYLITALIGACLLIAGGRAIRGR